MLQGEAVPFIDEESKSARVSNNTTKEVEVTTSTPVQHEVVSTTTADDLLEEEIQFDPTVSSGHLGNKEADFRSVRLDFIGFGVNILFCLNQSGPQIRSLDRKRYFGAAT